MACVFLNLCSDSESFPDPEGVEVASNEAVHAIALHAAREIIAADVLCGTVDLSFRIEVLSETGDLVHRIDFSDAIIFSEMSQRPALAA